MAYPIRFCGRSYRHGPHNWQEGMLYQSKKHWPWFACDGQAEGPTEEEWLRGIGRDAKIIARDTEESGDDAARRFALRLERIREFINNKDNHIFMNKPDKAGIETLIRLADLKMFFPEDDK